VYINPVKAGFVSSSIILEVVTYEHLSEAIPDDESDDLDEAECSDKNMTMFIEIPILASVVNHTQMFSGLYFEPELKGIQSYKANKPT